MNGEQQTPEERRAVFRVIRGEPTDAEVAALTVVLTAATTAAAPQADASPSDTWNDPAARVRTSLAPGPSAWRTSTWPN